MTRIPRRICTVIAAVTAVSLLAACGNDDPTTPDDTEAATDAATEPTEPATSEPTGAGGDAAVITAIDYEYEGVPATVAAGTQLTLTNESTEELHELVAFKLPDGEERPLEELAALSECEFNALVAGPPTAVLIAPPGGAPQIPALGDGTLTEPGRYMLACFIPQGADPEEYMEAAQNAGSEPPQVEGTGPPHIALGMVGEITVE